MRFTLGTLGVGILVLAAITLSNPYGIFIAIPLAVVVLALVVGAFAIERSANDDT